MKYLIFLFIIFYTFSSASHAALGNFGVAMTGIHNSEPGHSGWASVLLDQNEFAMPGLRVDYLNRFKRTENLIQGSYSFKNLKKQTLTAEAGWTPGAIIYPAWFLGLTGSAPVPAQPIEVVFGGKFSSYSNSTVWMLHPGFDGYVPGGWVFSTRLYFSRIKAPALLDEKWVTGFLQRVAWYYAGENYIALFYSRNTDTSYDPLQVNYFSILMHNLGAKWQHWMNGVWALQTEVQWQYRQDTFLSHWITGSVGVLVQF
jgi:YaiO family outer membrane protein